MAVNNDLTVLDGLTKKVYGRGVHQAVPDNVKVFFDTFPFAPNQEMLGDKFVESVNLGVEQGVTFGSGTAGVVNLNTAIAGKTKQALVDASMIAMQAQISWDLVAKASGSDTRQSFEKGVTQVVDNILIAHRRYQTLQMLYGNDNVGVIATGVASATQTLTLGSTAPGVFYGADGALFDIYDPTLATKRNGSPLSLTSYSIDGATPTLTFGASVTSTTGDVVVPTGWVSGGTYVMTPGLTTIVGQQSGTLFGLSQTTYPMFRGTTFDVGGAALTLAKLDKALVQVQTRGFSGRMKLMVNPQTFSGLSLEETARVQLLGNNGNATGSVNIGYDELNITTSTGSRLSIVSSPWIKQGEAWIVPADGSFRRIGAVDIKLGGPMQEPAWQRLIGATGYYLPTYSLQTLYTAEPWKAVKLQNIVNA